MSDLPFPHNHPLTGKSYQSKSGLRMALIADCTRYSLQISARNLAAAEKTFGSPIPFKVGHATQSGASFALCLSPEEWLLWVPAELANAIAKNFNHLQANTPHSLVDISHRQVAFEVNGLGATTILSAGCPLDLSGMPVGRCARSLLDKVQITLLKMGEEDYRIEVQNSFAPFAWDFLEHAARQYEAEMTLPT